MSSGRHCLWAWFSYLFVAVSLVIYFPTLTVRSMDGLSGPIGLSRLQSLSAPVSSYICSKLHNLPQLLIEPSILCADVLSVFHHGFIYRVAVSRRSATNDSVGDECITMYACSVVDAAVTSCRYGFVIERGRCFRPDNLRITSSASHGWYVLSAT